jgi:hypothetical protein
LQGSIWQSREPVPIKSRPRLLNKQPRRLRLKKRLHQQHVHRLHCRPLHKLLKPRLLPFSLRPLLPLHLLHHQ